MRPPRFWSAAVDPKSREGAPLTRFLLTPLAWLYATVTAQRLRRAKPLKLNSPVICIGNLTVGGTGKSPVVAALRDRIRSRSGLRVASLSRGYKGRLEGPCQVEPGMHSARDVGDEPLMLAISGESWIGADRARAGQAMENAGVDVIIMDDGFQNPGLNKDISILVIDAETGFGNGHVIPKGPLREQPDKGLARADFIVQLGNGALPPIVDQAACPIIQARITPIQGPAPGRYVAFAGIGRPEKFFDTLRDIGIDLCDAIPFPDHYSYRPGDLAYLRDLANDHEAQLITTEKDFSRLSRPDRAGILTLKITVQFEQEDLLDRLIEPAISGWSSHG